MALDQATIDEIVEALMQTEEMQFIRQKLMADADAERAPGEDLEAPELREDALQAQRVVGYCRKHGVSWDEGCRLLRYQRPRRPLVSHPEAEGGRITAAQVFAHAARHGCSYSDAAVSLGAR